MPNEINIETIVKVANLIKVTILKTIDIMPRQTFASCQAIMSAIDEAVAEIRKKK